MQVLAKFVSDSGHDCEIREGKDGVIYCTCLSWRFSRERPKTCKHITRIQQFLITGDRTIFKTMILEEE